MSPRRRRRTKAAPGEKSSPLWPRLVAPLAALLAHASYIAVGFTWLDHGDVVAGRAVLPLGRLHHAFVMRMGDTGFFRPLVVVVHSLDHALFGTWAPGHHLTSVALLVLVVAAVPRFLGAFVKLSLAEEVLASVVVAVHPLSWLVTGGLTYQQELLATLFTLLAVSGHAEARRSGAMAARAWTVACVALAAFSKETSFFWVFGLIALWEVLPRKDSEAAAAARWDVRLFGLEAAAFALVLALRAHAVPEVWRTTAAPLSTSEWFGVRVHALLRSLLELASPVIPSLSDVAVVAPPHPAELLILVGLAVGALVLVIRKGLESPLVRTILVLGLTLAPALRLVPVSRFASPHYTFPATAAWGALLVLALRAATARSPLAARGAQALLLAWALIAAASTFAGGPRFRDDVALFEPEVRRDPQYPEGHAELGRFWLSQGEAGRAREHLEQALRPRPGVLAYLDVSMTRVNLALALAASGAAAEADAELRAARESAPAARYRLIDYNRARLAAQGSRDAEVVALLAAHDGTWTTHEPYLLLARSLGRMGRRGEARRALENAARVAPPEERPAIEGVLRSLPEN